MTHDDDDDAAVLVCVRPQPGPEELGFGCPSRALCGVAVCSERKGSTSITTLTELVRDECGLSDRQGRRSVTFVTETFVVFGRVLKRTK